jgi:hypothetical protein
VGEVEERTQETFPVWIFNEDLHKKIYTLQAIFIHRKDTELSKWCLGKANGK